MRTGGDAARIPPSAWWLGSLLLALTVAAVLWGVPHARDDLTVRAEQALGAAGYRNVAVDFDGRDAQISGEVGTAADGTAVESIVLALRGVRRVDRTALTFTAQSATTTIPPAPVLGKIRIEFDGATVLLAGTLPTQAGVDDLVAAATSQFAPGDVTNELAVDASAAAPPWTDRVADVVAALDGLLAGSLEIDPDRAVIEGTVPDQATAEAIAAALSEASGLSVDNALQTPRSASLSATVQRGTLTLSGTLPATGDVEAVGAAAREVYATVEDQLSTGPVFGPEWLEAVPELFPLLADWPLWTLNLGAGEATLSGFASNSESLDMVRAGIANRLGITGAGFAAEVLPRAIAAELTALLAGSTTFGTGSATLSEEARQLLDRAIEILAANTRTNLVVEGHTDDQGSDSGNLALSQARADAVVGYLVAGGIDPDRLTAVGRGEEAPIADNATAAGRAQNRRIEFVVEAGGAG